MPKSKHIPVGCCYADVHCTHGEEPPPPPPPRGTRQDYATPHYSVGGGVYLGRGEGGQLAETCEMILTIEWNRALLAGMRLIFPMFSWHPPPLAFSPDMRGNYCNSV